MQYQQYIKMSTAQIKLNNGQTINYFQIGQDNPLKKPTLFFIHGNSSCWATWLETITNLAPFGYHMVAVDLRGFGDSSYHTACHHLKDWVEDLIQFTKIKNIKQCIVIGWSFGGAVSMKLAETAPELVSKLILTSSTSHLGAIMFDDNHVQIKTYEQIRQHPRIIHMEHLRQSGNREAIKMAYQPLIAHVKDYSEEKFQNFVKIGLKQRCYTDVFYALANIDININAIQAKALVIHGKLDELIPLQSVRPTGEHFKNFEIWEGHGHLIPIEDNKRYVETVLRFIEDI